MKYITRIVFLPCLLITLSAFANEENTTTKYIPEVKMATKAELIEVNSQVLSGGINNIQNTSRSNEQNIKNIKQRIDISEVLNVNLDKIALQYEQQKELSKNIKQDLNKQNNLLTNTNSEVNDLRAGITNCESDLSAFNNQLTKSKASLDTLTTELNAQLALVNENRDEMASDVATKFTYMLMGLIFTILVIGGVWLSLRMKVKANSNDMESKLLSAKSSLEEESLSFDNKLIEVLEKQIKVSQEQSQVPVTEVSQEVDHSLSLKVADEITRMDPSLKGIKPLTKGVERIRANFAANGYEIVDLINKSFDERMNIDVINFVESDELEEGQSKISKIIRPQVNYQGVLIQRAQVDVAAN